ncbi:protocatechuate 3,4-dioxygenase [Pseudoalteromonas sp. SMS1]|uniref:dioxygenase family protein n=1 Tax=Pseudoalteromonas sp. SMS1 TaxID=2908894 RepID=UPI001F3AB6DD|nr:protocatechuate 3,4-dioxygenase [Pseudoalteromonas sp. SMS1]MCF2857592.1 protocatechuate 3,4-dioxygenase [Pseudoalteromonas sp. SMS1]
MKPTERRSFIKKLAIGTSAAVIGAKVQAQDITPSEMEGPYYPITPLDDKDADLTRVKGKSGVAKGEIIEVFGQVLDQNLNPIEGVTVDLWQANTYGKYHHPHDPNPKPIDENFQPWAILKSGSKGDYKIKTIMPGLYPIEGTDMIRTAHIHFKISKNGYKSLLTQMYFPNHPANADDPLILERTEKETALMTAKKLKDSPEGIPQYQFNFIIQKI